MYIYIGVHSCQSQFEALEVYDTEKPWWAYGTIMLVIAENPAVQPKRSKAGGVSKSEVQVKPQNSVEPLLHIQTRRGMHRYAPELQNEMLARKL